MPYKFGSYTSAYAGAKEFRRMVSSLSDKVDISILHYGRYKGYDEDGMLLDDAAKLLRVAKEYDCQIVLSSPSTELDKRSSAPKIAEALDIDFLLIIDSDEYIDKQASDWERFKQAAIELAVKKYHESYNIFGINVEDGPQTFRTLPRLWFNPKFIYYDRTHYGIKTNNPLCPYAKDTKAGDYERHPIIETVPYLTIRSDTSFRSDYQKDNRANYGYVLNNLDNQGLVN